MDERSVQLRLIEERPDWVLDEQTRTIGLRGIDDARRVLAEAHSPAAA